MVAAIGGAHVQPMNGHGGVADARGTEGTIGGQTFIAQSSDTRASGRPVECTPAKNGGLPDFEQSLNSPRPRAGQATIAGALENHASPITPTHTTEVFTAPNFVDVGTPASPATLANDARATSDAETASQTTPRETRKGSSLRKKLHTALKFAGAAVVIGGAATAVAAAATALATPVLLAGLGVAIGGAIVLTVNHFTRPAQA